MSTTLSRRERQIMDILYREGKATSMEVHERLPDPPSYSAVRATLRILEEKGHVRHLEEGPRYVFLPQVPRDRAKKNALRHLLDTFFEGSVEQAVAALLDTNSTKLKPEELERLSKLVEQAKKKGV